MPAEIYDRSRQLEIGIVGAGMSGICAAIKIKKELGLDSFTLFEQNADVGGVWYTNTYPGCTCDIESHLYNYSFEPNPNWTHNYAGQPEILNYFQSTAEKYGVYSHVKFNTFVKKLTWDENLLKWIVVTVDNRNKNAIEKETLFDIVINCPGNLRVPEIPKVFTSFEGPFMHSAEWNHKINLKNKKVAVVGSGASTIQIIPSIANTVKELHSYQRNPAYVFPRLQFHFSEFTKRLFKVFPLLMWLLRCIIFLHHEYQYFFYKPDTWRQKIAGKAMSLWRTLQIPNNKTLRVALSPKYPLGCKRIVTSELYHPAMNLPNVQLHTSPIDKVEGRNIYTKDGQSQEVDVLIVATGFKTQDHFAPMEITGENGENILKSWKKSAPKSFYGIAFSSTPNHFYLLGPNTGLPHNGIIFMAECQVNFIVALIKEMIKRNACCISLKTSAEDAFMETLKMRMKKTVFPSCSSWYTNSEGEVTALWPQNATQYWLQTRNVDFSNFDFFDLNRTKKTTNL